MRFAKHVFIIAGVWGLIIMPPLYFLESSINAQQPPAITHPEYFYGFIGVTLVCQILFLVIASNPIRFRPIMLIALLEKVSYVLAIPLLFLAGRVPNAVLATAVPDFILAVLFVFAYRKTPVAET